MKRRCIPLSILILSVAAALVALWPVHASSFPVEVVDDAGRTVVIKRQPKRIVSLAPSNTELLFAIGAGPRVVGVTNYCNYPKEALAVPKVGDLNLNYEALLALQPDLVVAVGSMHGEAVKRLEQLGLNLIVLEAKHIADVARHVRLLGKVAGLSVESLAASLEKRISVVKRKTAPLRQTTVFMEIWNEPLMTVGPGTYADEMILLAGGRNIAADAGTAWPQFSPELVIQRNPEVILLTCYNKAEVLRRKAWQGIAAVKAGRVFEVNPDIFVRPGPRLIDALEELAQYLHPEVFR